MAMKVNRIILEKFLVPTPRNYLTTFTNRGQFWSVSYIIFFSQAQIALFGGIRVGFCLTWYMYKYSVLLHIDMQVLNMDIITWQQLETL